MPMKVNNGGELQPTNAKGQFQKFGESHHEKLKDDTTKNVKSLKKQFTNFKRPK